MRGESALERARSSNQNARAARIGAIALRAARLAYLLSDGGFERNDLSLEPRGEGISRMRSSVHETRAVQSEWIENLILTLS